MGDYSVYIHTNKANGMKYVGITQQEPEKRWLLGYGYQKQEHFYRAIKKYGWDGFAHEVVATGLTPEEAAAEEQRLIELYDTRNNKKGYNKSIGGSAGAAGVEKSELARRLASERFKKLWADPEFCKRHQERIAILSKQDDIRQKISAASKGRKLSEETKAKISANRKGKGTQKRSAETIAKMKAAHAGGSEKVAVICIESGEIYDCINDAARGTGINKKQISNCCRGMKHYNTAGGYHWKYARGDTNGVV